MTKELVIIGAVAAGMSAAAKARRIDPHVNITVLEKGEHISYGACGLPYYISDVTKDHHDLMIRSVADFATQNIQIYLQHEVIRLLPEEKRLLVKDIANDRLLSVQYDELLIATGSSSILPAVDGVHFPNVFTLKTLSDGLEMKTFFMNPNIREVTIVGAGYIGLELVETMLHLGKTIRLIEYQSQILPQFDPELASIIEQDLMNKGVIIHTSEKVEEIIGDDMATEIRTDQGSYSTDAVVISVGVRPNTSFVQGTGIAQLQNGAIIVDEYQRTNLPHIFAAGDCATAQHLVLQKPVNIPLGTIANKQGRIAGENMIGGSKKFPGALGTSVVKIDSYTAAKTGISEKEAKAHGIPYKTVTVTANSHASYYPDPKPITIKLVYAPEQLTLLGAQMIGEEGVAKRIDVFATAIHNRMSTEDIGFLDLAYVPPYASVWDAVQIAANAAK